MKLIYLLAICAIIFLPSCKKDVASVADLQISGFGPAAFVGGDAISIYGSGFDIDPEKNIVSFNGAKGEVATASPNRLQVIVPTLTTSGNLTVTVNGKTVTSKQRYSIVNLLQGTYNDNFILTSDKQYLLRGDVVFKSKLIIQPGTVIYGEKYTHASLTASDVDFEGTAEHPIIFTSDQPPGRRNPGDWKGVTISAVQSGQTAIPNGIVQYMRVEYAGYFVLGNTTQYGFNGPWWGAALNITPTSSSTYKYLQVSYSASDGFSFGSYNNVFGGDGFFHHLIAFGCAGADYRIHTSGVKAQFGLGLKDPYYANPDKSHGIVNFYNAGNMNQLSNFTLVGFNPDARNILNAGPSVNGDAGYGVKIGTSYYPDGSYGGGQDNFGLFNSLIAAGMKAGVVIEGTNDYNWTNYESGGNLQVQVRNCFITGTAPRQLPTQGGIFGHPNWRLVSTPFLDITTDPKFALFASLNDTTRQLSFSQSKDDLGIKDLVDFQKLNNPGLTLPASSILINSAQFPPGSNVFSPYFDKNTTWVGAFGTEDWSRPWANFSPQTTNYNNN
ncbi:MAG: IPT/TIG domain-containing protein [Chitinophagaceae bacterium]|nr:IPT/TIG domain-containing protein [Chitinophagaceae bacterium]